MLKKTNSALFSLLIALLIACGSDKTLKLTETSTDTVSTEEQLSYNLLLSAYGAMPTDDLLTQLGALDPEGLVASLDNDAKRLAFWINTYNALIQVKLQADTLQYGDRNAFFAERDMLIAGELMSFNDIEHGILRRNKYVYSLGYFNRLGQRKSVKRYRLNDLDWRIHFALNCGARSCPPVAFYRSDRLDKQLNEASRFYLSREIDWTKRDKLKIPALFLWFRADFGGHKGITKILQKFGDLDANESPNWSYKDYDWSVDLSQWHEPGSLINP